MPGLPDFAPPGDAIEHEAKEALELWLETHLQQRMLPPRPPRTFKARKRTVLLVSVDPKLTAKLELRWMCEDLGLTQASSRSLPASAKASSAAPAAMVWP